MSDALLLNADALRIPLADGSVHCCITSPPYYSLRDYGIPGQLGLEPSLEEYIENMVAVFCEIRRVLRDDGTCWLNLGDSYAGSGGAGGDYNEGGLREGQPRYQGTASKGKRMPRGSGRWGGGNAPASGHLKPKDLMGVPWRVAFALQADGWYLRSDIIWAKPNPMPESVTDRPTKSHEYLFLLTKQARYFYDADAIRESVTDSTIQRLTQPNLANQTGSNRVPGKTNGPMKAVGQAYSFKRKVNEEPPPGQPNNHREDREDIQYRGSRNRRTVWEIATAPYSGAHFATFPPALVEPCIKAGTSERGVCPECGAPWERMVERTASTPGRNNQSLANPEQMRQDGDRCGGWINMLSITTGWQPTCTCQGKPYTTKMPCPNCNGTGQEMIWKTELERKKEAERTGRTDGKVPGPGGKNYKIETGEPCQHCKGKGQRMIEVWPDDKDNWPTVPATVFDPFAGSGTTLLVARQLGRHGVGTDLSMEYLRLAKDRTGLTAWDEWQHGKKDSASITDLPLFSGASNQ